MSIALKTLKEELKNLATTICESKDTFKGSQRVISKAQVDEVPYQQMNPLWQDFYKKHVTMYKAQYEFRHRHIAYCLVRGTPIEKIETLPKDGIRSNKPNMDYVNKLVTELNTKLAEEAVICEQTLCNSEKRSV